MAGQYTCPVCGWSAARDPSQAPSLCRLRKESAIFASKGVIVSPGEWARIQQALESSRRLQRENRRIGPLEEELYRLRAENQQLREAFQWAAASVQTPVDESLWEVWDHSIQPRQGVSLPKVLAVPAKWRGEDVTRLGDLAFAESMELETVVLPEGISGLGVSSFQECENLTRVYLPSSLRVIDREAFGDCTGLVEIWLPEGLQELKQSVFFGCVQLRRMNLPSSLRIIGESAFALCKSLSEIRIPDSVESIGPDAFWGCDSLRRLSLPDVWKQRTGELKQAAVPPDCQVEYR